MEIFQMIFKIRQKQFCNIYKQTKLNLTQKIVKGKSFTVTGKLQEMKNKNKNNLYIL